VLRRQLTDFFPKRRAHAHAESQGNKLRINEVLLF
jgi:hypothetical protein